nr:cytochrome-c oxidase [Bacillus sp. FJAT-47783]
MMGGCLGLYMLMTHHYSFTSVHAHISFLGWTALTLAGLIYHFFPETSDTGLAKAHFWLHNLGLPVMLIGLIFFIRSGEEAFIPVITTGGLVTTLSILLFGMNILTKLKAN